MRFQALLFLIVITTLLSCERKFDKQVWQSVNTDESRMSGVPARATMVKDLLANYHLAGKDTAQIIQLLGHPDNADSTGLVYDMIIEYDGIDPDYIKSFLVELKNGIATDAKIVTWDHGQPK